MRQVGRHVGAVACVRGKPRQRRFASWRFIQALRLNPHNQSLIWRQIYGLIRDDYLAIVVRVYGDHAVTPLYLRVWLARCRRAILRGKVRAVCDLPVESLVLHEIPRRFHKPSKKSASSTRTGSGTVPAKTSSPARSHGTGLRHSVSGSTPIPCLSSMSQTRPRNFRSI